MPAARGEHPRLEMRNIGLRFGRVAVLEDMSLTLRAGEIVAVLGDSGCGKSSLLRVIAGLERPGSGAIYIDGRRVSGAGVDAAPESRGVGLMFQDYALFPHLTVLENVCFGLARRSRAEARGVGLARLRDVGLSAHAASYPQTLSGGEAQRVALARALAPRPRVLLLDEPFSNLDQRTRGRLRAETLDILRADGTTALLVTHDPAEAVELADRIALMRAGRIEQAGSAEDVYHRPVSPFAARALGEIVELAGRVAQGRVETALGPLPAPSGAGSGPVRVCLRPDALRLGAPGFGTQARVLRSHFAGAGRRLHLTVTGLDVPIALDVAAGDASAPGDVIGIGFDPARAFVFPGAA